MVTYPAAAASARYQLDTQPMNTVIPTLSSTAMQIGEMVCA